MNTPQTISKLVYIFDPRTQEETIARHEQWYSSELYHGDKLLEFVTNHKITPLRTAPLGQLLVEMISIDVSGLRKMIETIDWETEPSLPQFLDYYDITDSEDWIYAFNCVDSVREFIDLCNEGVFEFNASTLQALFDLLDVDDYLNDHECHILHDRIEKEIIWENRRDFRKYTSDEEEEEYYNLIEPSLDTSMLRYHLLGYSTYVDSDEILRETFPLDAWAISYPVSLLYNSLQYCVENKIKIIKCKNCGKYFVPQKRSDAIYCDRQAPQDSSKTCKEYGARQAWQKTLNENEAAGLYRKIYMSKQMLVKRNPDIKAYQEAFEWFKVESKRWKAAVKAGTEAEDKYIQWLKEIKERKVLNNGEH